MTDGTMGFQVAPITEEDMSRVHSILTRAIDAVVGMSQLQKEVEAMRDQLRQMNDDLDVQRRRNNALEEGLEQSRKARQEAESKISEAQQRAISAENSLDAARRDADHYMTTSNGLLDQVAKLKRERDDAQYQALEASEKVSELERKFKSLKDIFDFGGSDPAPAVQTVTPPPVSTDLAGVGAVQASTPSPTPEPSLEPSRRYLTGWQAGALWDSDKSQYYLEDTSHIPF